MSGMNGLSDLRRQRLERHWEQFLVFEIIEQVDDEQLKLIANRNLVREKVEATEETEKVNDAVEEWLNDADELINEVHVWLITERKIELYSNMLLNKMKMLNGKCKFEPFAIPIPGLEYFSCANFVRFNSTDVAFDQLFEALNDRSSNIIGLYGSQGSGKTNLAKAVGEKAKYLKIFDAVLFVTVSQNSNVQILDQLVNSLNLRLDKNTETGRAIKIYLTLERMGPILVILDDVYEKFKLEDIGIFPNDGNRCKVLLITRYRQVCTLMNCQWKIPVQPLNEEEAWTLLKKYSSIDDESSSELLLDVAKKVASKCNRLPGTIKEVGSSLKSKPIEEWEASLHCLGHSTARYQIFLSFRGKDTRHSFTGSLYHALCQEGFKTFMDKDGLKSGNQISKNLIQAINDSRLSIIIFSENYAYSSWCLDELVTILECMDTHHQEVLPIFYKVNPSIVRRQKNIYGKAMAKHGKNFGKNSEKVKTWRSALFEVANLRGEHYTDSDGYEYEFIQMIVDNVNNMRNRLYIQSKDID